MSLSASLLRPSWLPSTPLLLLICLSLSLFLVPYQSTSSIAPARASLPLSLFPNQGREDRSVRFQAHGMGGTLFFTPQEVLLSLPITSVADDSDVFTYAVRLRFDGANPAPALTGLEPLRGSASYFIGSNPDGWRTDLQPTRAYRIRHSTLGLTCATMEWTVSLKLPTTLQSGRIQV